MRRGPPGLFIVSLSPFCLCLLEVPVNVDHPVVESHGTGRLEILTLAGEGVQHLLELIVLGAKLHVAMVRQHAAAGSVETTRKERLENVTILDVDSLPSNRDGEVDLAVSNGLLLGLGCSLRHCQSPCCYSIVQSMGVVKRYL